MTEAEWDETRDQAVELWSFVQDSPRWTPRKLRLFVAAFWRWQADRLAPQLRTETLQRVEAFDRWAETGRLSRPYRISRSPTAIFFNRSPADAAFQTVLAPHSGWGEGWETCRRALCDYLRDAHGNPFRPVALDPAWRTEAVVALARGIYEERAFERLPVLADALDDVGCADADVLAHCRGGGPHARGCWVVDLLLGKT